MHVIVHVCVCVYCLILPLFFSLPSPPPSPSVTPLGGNIASSWAVLQVMGQDGYLEVADRLMKVTQQMREGIGRIDVSVCPPCS